MKTSKVLAVIVACLLVVSSVPLQALFNAGFASADEPASTEIEGGVADVPAEGGGGDGTDQPGVADEEAIVSNDSETESSEEATEDSQAELVESVLAGETSEESDESDEPADAQTLTYEDDAILATATADPGVLPEGATLSVTEVLPTDADTADAYGEALAGLSGMLHEQGETYSSAAVFDVTIYDADGNPIEPDGYVDVSITYKNAVDLGAAVAGPDDVQLAHVPDEGDAALVDAAVDTNVQGQVTSTDFTTDAFSYYVVFNGGGYTDENEATMAMNGLGWIKFYTSGKQDTTANQSADPDSPDIQWGYYKADGSNLPTADGSGMSGYANNRYRRIVQVRLWTQNDPTQTYTSDSDFNETNFTNGPAAQYFWTWQNTMTIEDFQLSGYEAVHTRMHTAFATHNGVPDTDNNSLIGTYNVRGYAANDGSATDLNVLDVYVKKLPDVTEGTNYIVRYVHADGSVTDGNVRTLTRGQTASVDASQYVRDGEEYAGIAVPAGVEALGNTLNRNNGSCTISYNANVPLSKVYVYYKAKASPNGNKDQKGKYDKDENGYYTGKKGLYTDKSAEAIDGNDRQFMLTLESWYVDKAASVGMVLDASGSMAWTAGAPTPIKLTEEQLNTTSNEWVGGYGGHLKTLREYTSANDPIPDELLNQILDPSKTDNSNMGYNGYHYYIYDERSTIKEYVALGYATGKDKDDYAILGQNAGKAQLAKLADSGKTPSWSRAGWYFVNSGDASTYSSFGSKQYIGVKDVTSYRYNSNGGLEKLSSNPKENPSNFYVQDGYLYCQFWDGEKKSGTNQQDDKNAPILKTSVVYEKRDQMFTKNETLQDSVAQFGAILLGENPDSQISMTRFSRRIGNGNGDFKNTNKLPLLNWTSDTEDVAAAMNLQSGSKGDEISSIGEPGFYVYGLTGDTTTWSGVDAYNNKLKDGAGNDNSKYLVIFTDGKDTNGDAPDGGKTKTYVDELKNEEGYTIITVLMRSQSMAEGSPDLQNSRKFLQGLASDDPDNPGEKLYFEADSNSTKEMVEKFRDIAHKVVGGLDGYSVRDYIDPRFDVVSETGEVLSVLDENGNFTHETNPDVDTNGLRGFTTPDHKYAYLGYDKNKKMFYVLWEDQKIPSTAVGSNKVNPWKSQVRVQAKEDFLGGNDVLGNGNEKEMNTVYKPQGTNSIGDRLAIDKSENYKDFPLTTLNPGTLDMSLTNYEDTVFLGEGVSPYELYQKVAQSSAADGTQWYLQYLERFGSKKHNGASYYEDILKGGNPGSAVAGETVSVTDDAITITLPYFYLEDGVHETDSEQHATYAGGDKHQADQVGTLTYTWKKVANPHTASDGYFKDFTTDKGSNDGDIRYEFSVKYEPKPVGDAATGDDGSARSKELTNNNKLVRNAVGDEVTTKQTTNEEGIAVVHVVEGKILIEKKVATKYVDSVTSAGGDGKFTFALKKDNADFETYSLDITNPGNAWTKTSSGDYTLFTQWVSGLPQGVYTLTETIDEGNFVTSSIEAVDSDVDDSATGRLNGFDTYDETTDAYAAKYATGNLVATWHIGKVQDGTPSACVYNATSPTYATVTDAAFDVDPAKAANGGKNHLNAQVGEGVVENTMIYELPAAGGPGVYPFLLVGAFVSTFMAWAVRDKHRRYATASRRFALAGVIEGGD
ncbi:hypothetical protein [Slackia heliotrinireducens]|uniref:hypothetical protein n=1 Tax=Slackia heliotrinireducens TaxID=84110 RepID=UPI003314E456